MAQHVRHGFENTISCASAFDFGYLAVAITITNGTLAANIYVAMSDLESNLPDLDNTETLCLVVSHPESSLSANHREGARIGRWRKQQ